MGSLVDLSSLVNFVDRFATGTVDGEYSLLQAAVGGTIRAGNLTYATGVDVPLDSSGNLVLDGLQHLDSGRVTISGANYGFPALTEGRGTAFTISGVAVNLSGLRDLRRGSITLDGGTANVSGLTNIDGASLIALGGATLTVPARVTHYTHDTDGNSQTRTLRAEGVGSVLDLSPILSVTNGPNYDADLIIEARSGGAVCLLRPEGGPK
jgi:hypothetical protein